MKLHMQTSLPELLLSFARKHANALALIAILTVASIVSAIVYLDWQSRIAPGTLIVQSWILNRSSDQLNRDPITALVMADNQEVGSSWSEIQLVHGNRVISFEDYKDSRPPQPQTVFIAPHNTTVIDVTYTAPFGLLEITVNHPNRFYGGNVFLDGEFLGDTYYRASQDVWKVPVRIGNHVVAVCDLEGYTHSANQTVDVDYGQWVNVTLEYN